MDVQSVFGGILWKYLSLLSPTSLRLQCFHLLQGWYGCGFGYGMWVGILMALGFKVVPVRAQAWKSAMGISGRLYTKVCIPCQNSCIYVSHLNLMKLLEARHLDVELGWHFYKCSWMQDDSRTLAMALFPDLGPQLKRKKDHGMDIPSVRLAFLILSYAFIQ